MRRIVLAISGCLVGAVLLTPGTSHAAVGCVLGGPPGQLQVAVTDPDRQASLDVSGNQIRVFSGPIPSTGGTDLCAAVDATTTNVTEIVVDNDTGGDNLTALISLQGGAFAPGSGVDESGAAAEIEIGVFGEGGTDTLEIEGGNGVDDMDLGESAAFSALANLNPAGDAGTPDCDDVNATNVENVVVHGRQGDDDINATACNGIAGATPLDPDSLLIEGNNQPDAIRGGPGADTVTGGTQDDNVKGGDGDDSVAGDDQDDKLDGGASADSLEGGDGTDRALYDDRTTGLNVTVGNGAADDGGSQDQSGSGRDNVGATVEHVTGGSAGDSISGSSVRNVLNGGGGDDVLNGLEGNDDLEGEDGNDTMDGGGGNDEVRGAAGTDTGNGGSGADDLFGGDSADRLFGGAGADFIKGDKGKDTFSGQAGNDKLNAKDRKRDKKISCGKGKASKESAKVDKQDPKAKSC